MVRVEWGLTAATTAGAVLVVSVAIALDLVGATGPWMVVPTLVGVAAGYAIYRRFSDRDPIADALN